MSLLLCPDASSSVLVVYTIHTPSSTHQISTQHPHCKTTRDYSASVCIVYQRFEFALPLTQIMSNTRGPTQVCDLSTSQQTGPKCSESAWTTNHFLFIVSSIAIFFDKIASISTRFNSHSPPV